MATKKISELAAINEADSNDVLVVVDVSEGTTNKITKGNLLAGAGHSIEIQLNSQTYQLEFKLKNAAGTELSTASIDLPSENAVTNIEYSNGNLTITKQSGTTSQVDISGLIEGLATETALNNLANALKAVIGISTNTYDSTQTYNTGDIVIQNEKIYKCIEDEVTGTFDAEDWQEISLYEYQKMQDEAIEENYKVITKLEKQIETQKEIIDQMPQVSDSGEEAYLADTIKAPFTEFDIIGHSEQESTTGKNLCTGAELQSDENIRFYFDRNYLEKTFTLSFICNEALNGNSVYLDKSNGSEYLLPISSTANTTAKVTITLTDEQYNAIQSATYWNLRIYKGGASFTVPIEPMIQNGPTATTYEPYTGGQPAPSPSYPYPIKSCGENVNEFNLVDREGDYRGATISIVDGIIRINGTTNSYGNNTFESFQVKETKDYTFSMVISSIISNMWAILEESVDNSSWNSFIEFSLNNLKQKSTKTLNKEKYYRLRLFTSTINTYDNLTIKLKLEQGTKASPYSPYGCGNVNVKLQNRNLFINDFSKYSKPYDYYICPIKLKVNEIYRFWAEKVGETISGSVVGLVPYGNQYSNFKSKLVSIISSEGITRNTTVIITEEYTDPKLVFFGTKEKFEQILANYNIQLEPGSTATDYVPHEEQNISFPLAQGQKFYEGSYPDDDEKVHHKMREVVINGSESGWRKYNDNEYYTTGVLQDAKKGTSAIYGYCDKVKREANGQIKYNYLSKSNDNLGLDIKQVSTYWGFTGSTVEELKQWLSENPFRIQYELEEETTEDFTEEQKEAWKQIKEAYSYKGETYISSPDEVKPRLEVSGLKDLNVMFKNLTNAIISQGANT